MLMDEEKALIERDAKAGYLPLTVLAPVENQANKHFLAAVKRAEALHPEDQEDSVYPLTDEDEKLRLEYNAKIHEIVAYWEKNLKRGGFEGG